MRVHLGSDHAGYELKERVAEELVTAGYEVVDHGPAWYDPEDDYPPYCLRAARGVVDDPGSLGVVIGGSGNGEQIAANKVAGVRAALAWSKQTAELARLHNDANIVAIGGRMHEPEEAAGFIRIFLETGFPGEERHARRIRMLTAYEQAGELPPLPPAGQE